MKQQSAINTGINTAPVGNHQPVGDLRRYEQQPNKMVGVVADSFQHEFTLNMITVTQKSISIAAADKKRRYLLIQNVGTQDVYIGFGGTPIYNDRGILLLAGTSLEFTNAVPNNEIKRSAYQRRGSWYAKGEY